MTILKLVKAKLYHCPVIQSVEVVEANDVRLKGRLDASVHVKNYFSANDYWQGNKIKLEALLNLLTQVLVSLYLWDTEMGWHVGHILHYPSRGQEPAKVKDETLEEMGQGAHSFKCSYLIPSLF